MASEFKDISDLIKQGMQVEAIEKLLDLREMMADIRDENLALKDRLQALEKSLEDKSQLTYEPPFYWMVDGGKKDGPFCQKCFDADDKRIRLQGNSSSDRWNCRVCTSIYNGPNYVYKKRAIVY